VTTGIGNPDWQRRYTFSAVPLHSASYGVNGGFQGPVVDGNGFEYIIVTAQMGTTTSFTHIFIDWYQDSAGTIFIGGSDFMPVPTTSYSVKIPTATRYFRVRTQNAGGGTTGSALIVIYGTNADQVDTLTGATSVPIIYNNQSLGASAIVTVAANATYGGEVIVSVDDNVNNKWTAWAEYYDWSAAAWRQFWTAHGPDRGQSWTERIMIPYSPVRLNQRNDDTVAHTLIMAMVGS
jgi:hypothetical protein